MTFETETFDTIVTIRKLQDSTGSTEVWSNAVEGVERDWTVVWSKTNQELYIRSTTESPTVNAHFGKYVLVTTALKSDATEHILAAGTMDNKESEQTIDAIIASVSIPPPLVHDCISVRLSLYDFRGAIVRASVHKACHSRPGVFSIVDDVCTADVTLKIGEQGVTVPAHRCILAAHSKVFRAMLYSPFSEELVREVALPDDDVELMRGLVQYCYGIQPTLDEMSYDEVKALWALADKYDIGELVCSCVDFLARYHLRDDTAIELYAAAHAMHCRFAMQAVMHYIGKHWVALGPTVLTMAFAR